MPRSVHSRLERLEKRRTTNDVGVDMSAPIDPLQVAVLEEISEAARGATRPLKYESDSYMRELVRKSVARALVNAGLSPAELEECVPAYIDLFNSYFLSGEGG